MARQIFIGQNFSGQDFSNQTLTDYYRDCDFSNADFNKVKFNAVAVRCNFDGADFTNADIYRLYSPGSTFKGAKFGHNFLHTAFHQLMGTFNVAHNHQIIAEILRQHAETNITDKQFKSKCLEYIQIINDRKDLSWAELSRQAPDDVITWGFKAFRYHPLMYEKVRRHRPELEPEDLKNERLNIQTK